MSGKPKFVIFAHNATYDKLHQVATLPHRRRHG